MGTRERTGTAFQKVNCQTIYTIYVRKVDYERAVHVIIVWLNRQNHIRFSSPNNQLQSRSDCLAFYFAKERDAMTQPQTDLAYLRSEKAKAEQKLRSC